MRLSACLSACLPALIDPLPGHERGGTILQGPLADVPLTYPQPFLCSFFFYSLRAGVGLNLANADPTTCVNAVCRRALGLPPSPNAGLQSVPISREALLATIVGCFERRLAAFQAGGFAPMKAEYEVRDRSTHDGEAKVEGLRLFLFFSVEVSSR